MKNMRVVIALLTFCGFAHAQVEPASPPKKLTGLYVGVDAGLDIIGVNLQSNHVAFTSLNDNCNLSTTFGSFAPSAQLGYVHEFGFGLLFGLEADFSYNTNQNANLNCMCPTNPAVMDTFTFYNRMQGSLRGRVGYALTENGFFAFVTGGASLADLGLNYSNEKGDGYGTEVAQFGWLVGAGLEWKINADWSLRGEYSYVGYNTVDLQLPTLYGITDPNGAGHASSSANNLRIGVNYWFW